jgi:hypothetical protein
MSTLTKLEMANMVLNEDKKNQIKNVLKSHYGVVDVQYRDLSYGICIEIDGANSFRFIKSAIAKVLEVHDDTVNILTENEEKSKVSYVYLPEKDKALNKRLKKLNKF